MPGLKFRLLSLFLCCLLVVSFCCPCIFATDDEVSLGESFAASVSGESDFCMDEPMPPDGVMLFADAATTPDIDFSNSSYESINFLGFSAGDGGYSYPRYMPVGDYVPMPISTLQTTTFDTCVISYFFDWPSNAESLQIDVSAGFTGTAIGTYNVAWYGLIRRAHHDYVPELLGIGYSNGQVAYSNEASNFSLKSPVLTNSETGYDAIMLEISGTASNFKLQTSSGAGYWVGTDYDFVGSGTYKDGKVEFQKKDVYSADSVRIVGGQKYNSIANASAHAVIISGSESIQTKLDEQTQVIQQGNEQTQQTIKEETEKQTSAIGGFFSDLLTGIKDFFVGLFIPDEIATSGFSDLLSKKLGFIYQIPAMVVSLFTTLFSAFANAGAADFTFPGWSYNGVVYMDSVTISRSEYSAIFNVLDPILTTVLTIIVVFAFVNGVKSIYERILGGKS